MASPGRRARLTRIVSRPRTAARACPYCRSAVGPYDEGCACGVVYHRDCRAALDRCVTIGCDAGARGVPCRRCGRAITNDGDVCLVCQSSYHRACRVGPCCARPGPRPRLVTPREAPASPRTDPLRRGQVALLAALLVGLTVVNEVRSVKALVWLVVLATFLALTWALDRLFAE